MGEVIWSPRSLKDINEIALYISKDSTRYAEEQAKLFFKKVALLEKNTISGRMVPELQNPAIRQIICGHYRIIYELLPSEIISIITVHHQARLIENNPALKKRITKKKRL